MSNNTFRGFSLQFLFKMARHASSLPLSLLDWYCGQSLVPMTGLCGYSVGVVATGLRMGVFTSLAGDMGEMALWLKYSTTCLGTSARTHLARAAGEACNTDRKNNWGSQNCEITF